MLEGIYQQRISNVHDRWKTSDFKVLFDCVLLSEVGCYNYQIHESCVIRTRAYGTRAIISDITLLFV